MYTITRNSMQFRIYADFNYNNYPILDTYFRNMLMQQYYHNYSTQLYYNTGTTCKSKIIIIILYDIVKSPARQTTQQYQTYDVAQIQIRQKTVDATKLSARNCQLSIFVFKIIFKAIFTIFASITHTTFNKHLISDLQSFCMHLRHSSYCFSNS